MGSGGETMAPHTAGDGVGRDVGLASSKLEGKLECDTQSQATRSPSPLDSRSTNRRVHSARSQSERRPQHKSQTHTQSHSSASFYTVSSSRGRLRSPSPCVDPWEAQRTLERGNFIEGVLSISPGPSITCHPVGLTSSGGHVLLGHTGRPLPWLCDYNLSLSLDSSLYVCINITLC